MIEGDKIEVMDEYTKKFLIGYNIGLVLTMDAECGWNSHMIQEMHRICSEKPNEPSSIGFMKGYEEAMQNLSEVRKKRLSEIVMGKSKNSPNRER